MLSWREIFLLALVIALAVTVVAMALHLPPPITEEQYAAAQKTAKDAACQYSPLRCFWDWTTHDAVSFYTLVLAIFTGALGISTIGLWLQTGKAADASRAAAEHIPIVEGAYVYVVLGDNIQETPVAVLDSDKSGQVIQFKLDIRLKNFGKSPATIEGGIAKIFFVSGAGKRPGSEIRFLPNVIVGPGDEYPLEALRASDISEIEAANVRRFAAQIMVEGRFKYKDIWNVEWAVEFNGRYIGGSGRRFRIDNQPREKNA